MKEPRVPSLMLALVLSLWATAGAAECVPEPKANHPSSGESILQALSHEDVAQLFAEGAAMRGGGSGGAADCNGVSQILVIFNKSPARALTLLTQTHRQDEFIPTLNSVRSIERMDRESVDEHTIRILFTKLTYRVRNYWNEGERRMDWELDPSFDNDIRELRGYWRFYELDSTRTLAVYGSHVDVGPAIPKKLQNAMTRKTVRQTVRHFRLWVDSDGRYEP